MRPKRARSHSSCAERALEEPTGQGPVGDRSPKSCRIAGQSDRRQARRIMIAGADELAPELGVVAACRAVGLWRGVPARSRARAQRAALAAAPAPRPAHTAPPLALDPRSSRRCSMRSTASAFATPPGGRACHAARRGALSAQCAPCTACSRAPTAPGSGAANSPIRPTSSPSCWPRPQSGLVLGHHQAKGPAKWTCFHLYVILDIFSRQVVGWLIAERGAELAEQLIAETVARHNIAPGTLTLHADRGASMRSKPVAALLVDLTSPRATAVP